LPGRGCGTATLRELLPQPLADNIETYLNCRDPLGHACRRPYLIRQTGAMSRSERRLYAALEHYDVVRDWPSHEVHPVLPDELGLVHAFGASSTRVKDPEFFDGDGPMAICGVRVKVRLAIPFPRGTEDVCLACGLLVAQGVSDPAPRRTAYQCDAVVAPGMEGLPHAVECDRRLHDDPPHRSRDGHTWVNGPEDFTPGQYTS